MTKVPMPSLMNESNLFSRDLGNISIVATTKSTFAGAATIKSRFLARLSDLGASVTLIAENIPPALARYGSNVSVRIVDTSDVRSATEGATELLQSYLVEALVDECERINCESSNLVIWGSHLFPYGSACVKAKRILRARGKSAALIVFPVGADIWEIGRQIPKVSRDLLNSNEIDVLATYSKKFTREIKRLMDNQSVRILCMPPYLSTDTFHPINSEARSERRNSFDIPSNAIVFINHSNMRPVKRVDFCIEIVDQVARCIKNRPTYLLLLGPHDWELPVVNYVKILRIPTTDNVMDYLILSDYSINASLHDSFNTALLESMACGVVPVTSDRPAIAKSISEANAGFVFETMSSTVDLQDEISGTYPISAPVLQSLIQKLSSADEKVIDEYRRNARDLAVSKYSEDLGDVTLLSLIAEARRVHYERTQN